MDDLDYIKQEIEKLNSETGRLTFSTNDTRRAFHERICGILDNYYKSWALLLFFNNNGRFLFDNKTELLSTHLEPIEREFSKYSDVSNDYRNWINRSVIIDAWSTFEFSITAMASQLLGKNLVNELKLEKYSKIARIIKALSGEEDSKLKKALEIGYISAVSINRKYEKLFGLMDQTYSRNIADDKRFLQVFGKYRNAMHSNFTFFGGDDSYTFQGVPIHFTHGKLIGDGNIGLKQRFDLVLELRLVFMAIANAFSSKDEILDKIA